MELDNGNERFAKRQKLANGTAKPQHAPGTSRIFTPYRRVGLISSTTVPFITVPLGKTTFQMTTSVGRTLQTYDLRRGLNLVFATQPQTPAPITATAAFNDRVLAAWAEEEGQNSDVGQRRGVWVFKRGKKEAELEAPPDNGIIRGGDILSLCIFGSWIVGVCAQELLVWKTSTLELYTTLRATTPVPFTNCIASLPTFLNKVIVGRHDGSVDIWNVSTGKLVYTLLPHSTAYGPVTALQPTPALSLVAIAFENGSLHIHDVRTDQTVIQLSTSTPTRSISFRTDGLGAGDDGRKTGIMATASTSSGDVTLWDLNNLGRRVGVLRAAHASPTPTSPGGTSKVEFLAGQAVLVTSGLDNSLKTWIFDETPFNPIPRILHERRGHSAPITKLMFLPTASDGSDDTGKWLVTGSRDRSLWGWSLRRDGQSTELSQGAVQKKAKKQGLLSGGRDAELLKCPPVTSIACSLNRDGGIGALPGKQPIWQQNGKIKQTNAEISAMTGWESVLTAHENDTKARTWFWGRKRAGRWAFDTSDGGNVTAVAISPCGTFGILGSSKGGIDMFNMQSGLHRQRFPARLTPTQAKQFRLDVVKHGLIEEDDGKKKFYRGQGKHTSAVVGIAIDSLNKTIIAASQDGKIKFWNFSSGLLRDQIDWSISTSILSMRFHRATDLAAFACGDGGIRVVDAVTQRLIRELWPSRNSIPGLGDVHFADFTFSDDGHWVAACAQKLVFVWDLPTGHLIDAFKLAADCTSLAFSPTGEFLATATVDNVGVDIWTNRSLFTHVPSRRITDHELEAIVSSIEGQTPTVAGENGQNLLTETPHDEKPEEDDILVPENPETELEQISADLLSLSLVPKSRWQNLLYLDLIRQRNKPVEPPKKPEKAPFFLPSLEDKQAQTASGLTPLDDTKSNRPAPEKSHRLARAVRAEDIFAQLLRDGTASDDYAPFIAHLKSFNPAAADTEIRSLGVTSGDGIAFVRSLTALLRLKCDFELAQAWMAVFLRVHGDTLLHDDEARDALEAWRAALKQEMDRVRQMSGYCNGLVGYLRAARV